MRLSALVLLFSVLLGQFSPSALAVTQDLNVTASIPAQASDFQNEIESLTTGSTFPPESTIEYQITYGSHLTYPSIITLEAQWYQGTIDGESSPSVETVDYVVGSATQGYNSSNPVVDTTNKKIAWTITLPGGTVDQTVKFKLKTNSNYTGTKTVSFPVKTRILGPGVTTPDKTVTLNYLHPSSSQSPSPSPTPSPTTTTTPLIIEKIEIVGATSNSATISVSTSLSSNITLKYGKSPTNLSLLKQSLINSKTHRIFLSGLESETQYFFTIEASAVGSTNVFSDIFTLNTARVQTELPKTIPNSFIAISHDNVLEEGKEDSLVIVPINTEFQFRFRVEGKISVKRIQAFLRPKVLGIASFLNTKAEANTYSVELIELSDHEYTGRIKSPPKKGNYELAARIEDQAGNIVEQKLSDVLATNPFTVLGENNKPIEGARIFFSIYNERTRLFDRINQQSISMDNPSFTNSMGELGIALPKGKYRAEISDIRFKDQEVIFTIDKGNNYPIVTLEKEGLSLFNIISYYMRGLDEVYLTNTKLYLANLATSIRFFDLIAAFSLGALAIVTLFAFSKRHNVPIEAIHRYIPLLFEKNKYPERFIKGTIEDNDQKALSQANVYLLDEEKEEIIARTKSDRNGSFFFKKNGQDKNYKVMAMKEGFESHPVVSYKDGTEITMILNKNEHISAPIHYIKHLFTGSMGLTFEVFLISSLFFELLFLDTFGIAKTIPYFTLTFLNFAAWILLIRHPHSKVAY